MVMNKVAKRLITALLATVRGPLFLATLSFALLAIVVPAMLMDPAQATLLKGYVHNDGQQDVQPQTSKVSEGAADRAEAASGIPLAGAALAPTNGTNALNASCAAACRQAAMTMNSYPSTFEGSWRVVSVVVDSAVSSVPIGEKVESEVDFVRSADGRIIARWGQPGWTEAKTKVMPISDREVAADRTNFFVEDGGGWAARSQDHYMQLNGNRIAAASAVDQYVAGQYVGRYKTTSTLYRMSGNLALAE
jgi:hypothetical protein